MCGMMQLCQVYLEFFISSRMPRVTGDNMGETWSYQFTPSGSDVLCAFELCLCSAWAPANGSKVQHTRSFDHPSPPARPAAPWQLLRTHGVPLSSFSHSYWQQLPGISWADNGDSSKKFLFKTYGVSGVCPGLLPSLQILWLHSVSRVQCSLMEDLAFSKVSDFFQYIAFRENSSPKVLEVEQWI